MATYLVVSDETDSVVAEGADLRAVVTEAAQRGYVSGYVTNQNGAWGDLAELVERFGLSPQRRFVVSVNVIVRASSLDDFEGYDRVLAEALGDVDAIEELHIIEVHPEDDNDN